MEGGMEGGKEHGGVAKKGDHGKTITFPGLMCCMWTALGTNERFSVIKEDTRFVIVIDGRFVIVRVIPVC